MRVRVEHLLQDRKTGRVSYRRSIPAALRPFVGRSEIKKSLGVHLPPGAKSLPAVALAAYSKAHEEAEKELRLAAARAAGREDTLDAGTVTLLAEWYSHALLSENDASRRDDLGADALLRVAAEHLGNHDVASQNEPSPEGRLAKRVETYSPILDVFRRHYALGTVPDFFQEEVVEFCGARGLVISPVSSGFSALCHALLEKRIAGLEVSIARDQGAVVPTPPPPAFPAADGLRRKRVSEVFASCSEVEVQTTATKMSWDTSERYFIALHGDLSVDDITRLHAVHFKEALQRLPAKMKAAERQRALAAKLNAGSVPGPRLAAKTINQHLSTLHKVWNWSRDHELLSKARVSEGNPFERLALPQPKRGAGAGRTKGFSLDQLRRMFALPVFTAGARPGNSRGEAAYWLPLLALFTGARREELAMLMVHDIQHHAASGRWQMTIGDPTHHPVKGERDTKTHAERTFPVHPELIRLGFIDHVRQVHRDGEKALFPRLTAANQRAQLGAKWGEWWGTYIRSAGIEVDQPMHAFRHTWTTAARAAGVPKDAREFIQGHAGDGSMNDTYGDPGVLGVHVDRIAYPGLDLSSLHKVGAEDRARQG